MQRRKRKTYSTECRVSENGKRFLTEQCKEIDETTEWERLEIPSRKSEILRTFHANIGTIIKDKNSKDLIQAEEIEKR